MMHSKIIASVPDETRVKLLEQINAMDDLEIKLTNTCSLIWMLSDGGDLSDIERGTFRTLEILIEAFARDARAIADTLGELIPGGERYPAS